MSFIKVKSQEISGRCKVKSASIFRVKINSNSYLVSSHCYLPIYSLYLNDEFIEKDDILINSNWNNLLIIKDNYQVTPTFDKIRKTILPIGTRISVGSNGCIRNIDSIEYFTYGYVPNYPRLINYVISGEITGVKIGDPILFNNNGSFELVGIVQKIQVNTIFALPSYYIFKTIERTYNDIMIPDINDINIITKIDNYKVNNRIVWNKHIKSNIPLDVNFLLESDSNQEYEIMNRPAEFNFVKIQSDRILSNIPHIISSDNKYLLTTRVYHLLKEIDPMISINFNSLINRGHSSDLKNKTVIKDIQFSFNDEGNLVIFS